MSMPKDPLSDLAGSSIAMHELYISFINAGCTEDQAMRLLIEMMKTVIALDSVGKNE